MKPILLVGPKGVGKTSAGKALSKILGLKFIDTDDVFFDENGSITEFIKAHGFSTYHAEVVRITSSVLLEDHVIASGGVVFMDASAKKKNTSFLDLCREKCILVLLSPSNNLDKAIEITYVRSTGRPNRIYGSALPHETLEELKKTFLLRFSVLKEYAHIVIYDDISPESCAKKIYLGLKKGGFLDSR